MKQSEEGEPLIVRIADSPDARLFIELSSHASDLTEARRALEMSIGSEDPNSPLREAAAYLMGFAVVAYCRSFVLSNVRKPLTDQIEIPPELLRTHELVRAFRNATIAHSQSDLAVTYPLGFLDPTTFEVLFVSGSTIVNTLPLSVAEELSRDSRNCPVADMRSAR